jgi:hypothetical protein
VLVEVIGEGEGFVMESLDMPLDAFDTSCVVDEDGTLEAVVLVRTCMVG